MRLSQRLRTWLGRQPDWVLDGAIALCAAMVKLSLFANAPADAGFRASGVLTAAVVLLSLTSAVPLTWRRRAPGPVLVVVGLSALGLSALDMPSVGFALVVALYSVAAYASRRESLASLAVFATLAATSLVVADTVELAAVNAVVFLSAWVLGDQRRLQRERTTALEQRARDLEQQRAAETRLAVAGERERIAGELHDLLAHSIAAMVTQGVAAERCIASAPDRATSALLQVERTGRQSLGDLRRLLALLRGRRDATVLAPQPDLDDLPALVGLFQQRGLPVRLVITGDSSPPPFVGLAAYRIVQAALDDVLAHAGAVPTTVTLGVAGGELVLEIADSGPAATRLPADDAGNGLAGMQERAALAGGTVGAGRRGDGRFAVRVRLPVGERVP